nr:MAG TPA: hypothetical protein [Caudoviricetes sp.]
MQESTTPPQAQSPNAYASLRIAGHKFAGLNFKQIIKCARIFRGTKSLNFEIFLYTVSIGRKIPSGVIAPPCQESKRALSKPRSSAAAIVYDIITG